MIIVISPAKKISEKIAKSIFPTSEIAFSNNAIELIDILKEKTLEDIENLMNVSRKIAELNHKRISQWQYPFDETECGQAIFMFQGEVYQGLKASDFDKDDIEYAQKHLKILSGLYGILKPLDAIMPYRLEMGTKLVTGKGKNLYEFWGDTLKATIENDLINDDNVLINLASNEYFKSLQANKLQTKIITPVFKDFKNGELKQIMMYAKKARGLMSRYIIKNKLTKPEDIKYFDTEGYMFDENISNDNEWIFTR